MSEIPGFIQLHRVGLGDRYARRGYQPALYVSVARIVAFGARYTDCATGRMEEDGGWISVDGCPGESPDGTFAVNETVEQIAERIQKTAILMLPDARAEVG